MTMPKALGLTSTTTQASGRFVFGNVFAEGEIPTGFYPHLDMAAYSSYIINRWPDGSVRLAAFTGTVSFTANVEKQVNIVSRSYPPTASTGTALTAAGISASGAAASVQFGTLGSVTLAGATLVQTHYADAQMICCEYRAKLGTTGLSVQFFVWLFADGKWFTRVTPWNGLFLDGSAQRDYVPTVTIDGVVVYNNGGNTYHHSPNTWYTFTRWSSGSTITPRHDTAKLIESGLFPNYTFDTPQADNSTYLSAISNYTPGANLGYSVSMGATGGQDDIGVLPMWEAMYFVQRGEKVAYDAVIAGANAIGMYGIFFLDASTNRALKISSYPTHTQFGAGAGGNENYGSILQDNSTPATYNIEHHPAPPLMAFVLTGDPFHMQTSQYVANACYLAIPPQTGRDGVMRYTEGLTPRGKAWTLRSVAFAAATCPTSQSTYYDHDAWYSNLMSFNSDYYADGIPGVGGFKVGLVDQYDNYGGNGYNGAGCPFWQHDFYIMSLGAAIRMKVGTSTGQTKAINFFNYLANSVAWRTAPLYFAYGPNIYHVIPKSTSISDTSPLAAINANPASAADIWNANNLTSGEIATLGDNILRGGGSTGTGPGSYWDQLLCALAYCVDFNTTSAVAGRARITGASNYTTTLGAIDRATQPVFAMSPLSVTHTPTFTAVDSGGTEVTTTGPSIHVQSLPLHTAGFFVTKQPGIGVPLSQIVGGGSDGTSPIYDAIQAAGGTVSSLSEIRLVAAPGAHGTYLPDETGGGVYTGDGASDTINVDYYLDGAQINSAPMYFGTAPTSTVTSVAVTPSTATGSTNFTAVVNGTGSPSQSVTWSRSGSAGSISSATGAFVAPSPLSSIQVITVTATSTQDGTKSGTATVTIPASVVIAKATTVTFAVVDQAGVPVNASGLDYAFYDQPRISAGFAPVKAGSNLAIQNGVATISITNVTNLYPGDKGRIEWGDANGTKHGGGPVTVT